MSTVVISGTTAIEDAGIQVGGGRDGFNYGSTTLPGLGFTVSKRRCLFRLSSALLPGGHITSLVMTMRFPANTNTVAGSLVAYMVKNANTWVEGSSNGAAEVGACCSSWVKTATQAWAGSAGCGTADVDYVNQPAPPTLAYGISQTVSLNWTLDPGWVHHWRDTVNNGFIVLNTDEADANKYIAFCSSENATPSYFTITYEQNRYKHRAKMKTSFLAG